MKLIWNGHACFSLECKDGVIVFDPFEDGSVPGIRNLDLSADLVLCSHEHHDHNARSKVTLSNTNKNFNITTIDCFHDDMNGTLRGKNKIHKITTEDQSVVHLGDLGHILDNIDEIKNCDVLLIPVGGHYTIDSNTAKQLIDLIQPRITIPMHYRTDEFGFDVISHLNEFTKLYPNIIYHNSNTLEITKETPKQIIVLTYI